MLKGGVIVWWESERADLESPSCPPDRQYNISRLPAHFVLSGSFTHCAVLGPLTIKGPLSLLLLPRPPRTMNHPNPLDSAKRKTARKSIITPQRKHHKMLKDGTSEVWP